MRQISQIPKNISQNIAKKYVCKSCDYTTSNKTDFNKQVNDDIEDKISTIMSLRNKK